MSQNDKHPLHHSAPVHDASESQQDLIHWHPQTVHIGQHLNPRRQVCSPLRPAV